MKNSKRKSDCPINFGLELFGDRWTFLIVRDLMFKGKHYFGEFVNSEEKIATNLLSDRLSMLESENMIFRSKDKNHKQKIIYKLTKKGIDLMPVLIEIIMWSALYDEKSAVDMNFVKMVNEDKEGLIKELTAHLISS
ncbi:helix-turn-helix transcriptional regulator [bacterium]|jgi:DNA-binding HxlR family transcriptional regulator|nr:helix-turn-helix transcriptional regulator [bacterium]MDG1393644.1 helix-turn-helix domain-containing protein [Flavobacteriaceae bacterium]|tara:strand:- start:2771 stop:3181 length:411 start_codon:yes stop_codon:yes gene_type:complete